MAQQNEALDRQFSYDNPRFRRISGLDVMSSVAGEFEGWRRDKSNVVRHP